MTDAEANFAKNKARDITKVAWSELCDSFMTLEDLKSREKGKGDLSSGEYAREMAKIYLLGTIAETLLSERLNK